MRRMLFAKGRSLCHVVTDQIEALAGQIDRLEREIAKRPQRGPATQRDRQQGADFAVEWLIGAPADMSPNPGKFQHWLA